MKSFLLLLAILSHFGLHSQYGEFSFLYRYGTSTDVFNKPSIEKNSYTYREAKTLNDQGIVLTYAYPIWKRFHINAFVGFEIAETKRYVPLIEFKNSRNLANINMNNNRASYRFGITKAFHFYDSKVQIVLGLTFAKRNYLKNNIVFESDYERKENVPWIDYKYVLTSKYDEEHKSWLPLYTKKPINRELSLAINIRIIENLFVHLNFSFSGNYYVLYDIESKFRYYEGGSTTPTSTFNAHGPLYSDGSFYSKRDHFLYTGIGLSYDFNFKKKEPSKI